MASMFRVPRIAHLITSKKPRENATIADPAMEGADFRGARLLPVVFYRRYRPCSHHEGFRIYGAWLAML
jgi:hypothetical protein